MKIVFLIGVLLCSATGLAQSCDCVTDFLWIKNHIEKNHPGFDSEIKSADEPKYKAFTDQLMVDIRKDSAGKYCLAYLKKYIYYLKDHHSGINGSFPAIDESNLQQLELFYKSPDYRNTEIINIDSAAVMNHFSSLTDESLEGIYITQDSVYTIAVMKNKNAIRDYAGVIIASRTALWKKGQVKLELKENPNGLIECYLFMRNHALNYDSWQKEHETPIKGLKKIYPRTVEKQNEVIRPELISFSVLDNQTACISVRSFSGQFNAKLDSAYKKIIPALQQYPNLIIDVRNNGGGSDLNYGPLMPLLYTDPIYPDFVEMYVTEENRKAYEKMRDEAKNNPQRYGENGFQSWQFRLNQMSQVPMNSYIAISGKNAKATFQSTKGYPKKVAILYNRNCASSCEQLLLDAMFSKKTTLVGENSGGYIAYGNVMTIQTPCGRYLSWTTTRKNRDRKYEFVGVPPQVKIPAGETNWIDYTRKLLQQK